MRDLYDVVHAVRVKDSSHDYGRTECGLRYFEQLWPLAFGDDGDPCPMNPTKERVSCLSCLPRV